MDLFVLSYYQVVIAWAFIYWSKSWDWFPENPNEPNSGLPWRNHSQYGDDTSLYFEKDVLQKHDGGFEPRSGYNAWSINGHLLFSLFVVWLITAACLVKGIHSAGKVAYVTVLAPFFLMAILFFRAISLEGAGAGIAYYLTPNIVKLFDPRTWSAACGQILFSLSPATGAAIALSSFNDRKYRHLETDAITIAITNSGFSVFSGFVVFAVCGNLAHAEGKPVEEIAQEGPGLAFVMFPRVLAKFNAIFSWFFFTTLMMLGLDSSFAWVQTLVTYIQDYFDEKALREASMSRSGNGNPPLGPVKNLNDRRNSQLKITVALCFGLFLVGIVYTTRNGVYILDVVDHFCPTYCLLFSAFVEFYLFGLVVGPTKMEELIRETCGGSGNQESSHQQSDIVNQGHTQGVNDTNLRVSKLLSNPTLRSLFFGPILTRIGPGFTGILLFLTFIMDLVEGASHTHPGLLFLGWMTAIIPILGFCYKANQFKINQVVYGHGRSSRGSGHRKRSRTRSSGGDGSNNMDNIEANNVRNVSGGDSHLPQAIGRGYPTLYAVSDTSSVKKPSSQI